ncbi:MAG: VOC family protein [Acidimicrobiia bacterium]
MNIMVIQYSNDPKRASEFYQSLGFEFSADRSDARWWEHQGGGGTIAVHLAEGEYAAGGHDLWFVSPEPLATVAARLESKGFSSQVKDEPWGKALWTTDPDGTTVQVTSSAPGG